MTHSRFRGPTCARGVIGLGPTRLTRLSLGRGAERGSRRRWPGAGHGPLGVRLPTTPPPPWHRSPRGDWPRPTPGCSTRQSRCPLVGVACCVYSFGPAGLRACYGRASPGVSSVPAHSRNRDARERERERVCVRVRALMCVRASVGREGVWALFFSSGEWGSGCAWPVATPLASVPAFRLQDGRARLCQEAYGQLRSLCSRGTPSK